jgi:hypothetical protein
MMRTSARSINHAVRANGTRRSVAVTAAPVVSSASAPSRCGPLLRCLQLRHSSSHTAPPPDKHAYSNMPAEPQYQLPTDAPANTFELYCPFRRADRTACRLLDSLSTRGDDAFCRAALLAESCSDVACCSLRWLQCCCCSSDQILLFTVARSRFDYCSRRRSCPTSTDSSRSGSCESSRQPVRRQFDDRNAKRHMNREKE